MSGWKCAQQLAAHADIPGGGKDDYGWSTQHPPSLLRTLLQIVFIIVLNQSAWKRNGVI